MILGGNIMAEDSWFALEREYFVEKKARELEIAPKKLNKILEEYNKFISKAVMGDSPYLAEDIKLSVLKSQIAEIENKYKGEVSAR